MQSKNSKNILLSPALALFVLALASCDHLIMPDHVFLLAGNDGGGVVQYRVIFETGDGSAVDDQVVVAGGLAIRPAAPFRSEHIFSGWYQDSSHTIPWDFTSDTVDSDITLEALWTPVVDPYNWADFGTLAAPNYPVPGGVDSAAAWRTAIEAVNTAAAAGNYVIDITGSFTLPAVDSVNPANPPSLEIHPMVAGTIVSLRGHNGAVISQDDTPSASGGFTALLDVQGGATVILRDLELTVNTVSPVIINANGKLLLKNGAVVCGTRQSGTKIFLNDNAEVAMEGNSRVYNLNTGIIANSANPKITMSGSAQIYGNTDYGIRSSNSSNITVSMSGNTQIYGNAEVGVSFDSASGGRFTMDGSAQIYGNGRGVTLGGVNGGFVTFVMTGNAQIHSNSTQGILNGGGVFLYFYVDFYMGGNAQIHGNQTTNRGGGVFIEGTYSNSTFRMGGNAQIHGNKATYNGGGVYIATYARFTIGGSAQIYGNEAGGKGGGVYKIGQTATFHMTGGVVYGSNEPQGIQNTAAQGAALFNDGGGGINPPQVGTIDSDGVTFTADASFFPSGNIIGDNAGKEDTFRYP